MGVNNPGGGGGGGGSVLSGTAAARPAAGTSGRLYWATDTNEISFDNGSAWSFIRTLTAAAGGINLQNGAYFGYTNNVITGQSFELDTAANIYSTFGVDVSGAGSGLRVKEGANCKQGVATLTAGSVVVANTSVTANSRILLTTQTPGGTPGTLYVSARTAGTSFTVTSTSGADTSTFAYQIFEPG